MIEVTSTACIPKNYNLLLKYYVLFLLKEIIVQWKTAVF